MITIRKSEERGRTRLDWLDSRHTFSFGEYLDRGRMGFGPLRVINEDRVAPGTGFGMHPHRDMEILTWVLDGELAHRDTLGSGSVIRPGDVQRMSAGTGILHSEENPSPRDPVHFLQVWIVPERSGLAPEYEQASMDPRALERGLVRVAGRDGGDGALRIHQDADLWAVRLVPGAEVRHRLRAGRGAWIQVARGTVSVNGSALEAGDGAAVEQEDELVLFGGGKAQGELLLFDLP